MNTIQDEEITGYTHMMRGYAYYNLIQSYGPCIILGDDILPNNELPETYNYSRSTYDECVDYCCNELELAAKYMPIDHSIDFFWTSFTWCCFCVDSSSAVATSKSVYIMADRPHRTAFGNWKRTVDGANYVNQNYDETTLGSSSCSM